MRRLERSDADKAVRVFGGAAQRRRRESPHPDRRPRLLDRFGRDPHAIDFVILALEGERLSFPQPPDDFEAFVGPSATLFLRDRKALEFLDLVAGANAQLEAASRNDI